MAGKGGSRELLLGAALVSFALWAVPITRPFLVPLTYLNTLIHEGMHALMTVFTGGRVGYILIHPDGSGVTLSYGGMGMLISSAGYLGAAALGGWLIWSSGASKRSQTALRVLVVGLILALVAFVRGEMIGLLASIFWILIFGAASAKLSAQGQKFLLAFVGLQQCLASIDSLLVLQKLSYNGETQSDAGNMAAMTGVPAIVWSTLWIAVGVFTVLFSLRAAWSARSSADQG